MSVPMSILKMCIQCNFKNFFPGIPTDFYVLVETNVFSI